VINGFAAVFVEVGVFRTREKVSLIAIQCVWIARINGPDATVKCRGFGPFLVMVMETTGALCPAGMLTGNVWGNTTRPNAIASAQTAALFTTDFLLFISSFFLTEPPFVTVWMLLL
jgi:hypothetical protein